MKNLKPLEWTTEDGKLFKAPTPWGDYSFDLSSSDFEGCRLCLGGNELQPAIEIADEQAGKSAALADLCARVQSMLLEPADDRPGPDDRTYYTEGKNADWYAAIGDAEFAREATEVAQDLVNSDVLGPAEDWMPIIAIVSEAGDRIQRLAAAGTVKPEPLGWLYTNEDTGIEFSEDHPVTSGCVPDATDIRPATAENLLEELLSTWRTKSEDAAVRAGTENTNV